MKVGIIGLVDGWSTQELVRALQRVGLRRSLA